MQAMHRCACTHQGEGVSHRRAQQHFKGVRYTGMCVRAVEERSKPLAGMQSRTAGSACAARAVWGVGSATTAVPPAGVQPPLPA